MTEYFIVAESFAAPFCSDTSTHWIESETPECALGVFRDNYAHPAGLYGATCFTDANAREKRQKPLAKWLCNHAIRLAELTAGKGCYALCVHGVGDIEIDGIRHSMANDFARRGELVPV